MSLSSIRWVDLYDTVYVLSDEAYEKYLMFKDEALKKDLFDVCQTPRITRFYDAIEISRALAMKYRLKRLGINDGRSHDHPLSGWHVLPLEGDITCLRPEGALKSANCTTFTAAPKLGAFSVLPYSGVASKEACWFALTSYFRSKRDLLIVFLHRLTRERVDILY